MFHFLPCCLVAGPDPSACATASNSYALVGSAGCSFSIPLFGKEEELGAKYCHSFPATDQPSCNSFKVFQLFQSLCFMTVLIWFVHILVRVGDRAFDIYL